MCTRSRSSCSTASRSLPRSWLSGQLPAGRGCGRADRLVVARAAIRVWLGLAACRGAGQGVLARFATNSGRSTRGTRSAASRFDTIPAEGLRNCQRCAVIGSIRRSTTQPSPRSTGCWGTRTSHAELRLRTHDPTIVVDETQLRRVQFWLLKLLPAARCEVYTHGPAAPRGPTRHDVAYRADRGRCVRFGPPIGRVRLWTWSGAAPAGERAWLV
jgi:hypothetical protein